MTTSPRAREDTQLTEQLNGVFVQPCGSDQHPCLGHIQIRMPLIDTEQEFLCLRRQAQVVAADALKQRVGATVTIPPSANAQRPSTPHCLRYRYSRVDSPHDKLPDSSSEHCLVAVLLTVMTEQQLRLLRIEPEDAVHALEKTLRDCRVGVEHE